MNAFDKECIAAHESFAITPFPGNLIVEKFHQEEKTTGGIVLPEAVRTDLPYGRVLAMGTVPLRQDGTPVVTDLSVGDIVFFSDFAGRELNYGGQKAVALEYSDLIGKLREEVPVAKTQ